MAEQDKTKPIEIDTPPDFQPPETDDPDGEFDVVCRFRPNGDKLCMVKLGEMDIPIPNEKEYETPPTYKGAAQRAVGMMDMSESDAMGYS